MGIIYFTLSSYPVNRITFTIVNYNTKQHFEQQIQDYLQLLICVTTNLLLNHGGIS
ncbi:MAG: hypothetical protein LBV72_19445 [Tannerella sp.]|jgi:hypothetical protein|nr:hypothetical protein [Tannerella sp.]